MPPVPALANQFNNATGWALIQAQSRLVTIAKSRHAAILQREPRPAGFVRYVDGRMGAAEEMVRVFGLIRYVYNRAEIGFEFNSADTVARLDEIAQFTLETLRAHSPVASGLYRDSHKLFRNGYPVDDLSAWKDGDEISITNYVAYSRILEVGDGRFRVAHGVYETASDIVTEKFGRFAKIEFTWRGITDELQIAQDPRRRRGFGTRVAGRRGAHNKSPARYPTIVITPAVSRLRQAANIAGNVVSIAHSAAMIADAFSTSAITRDPPMLNAPGTIDN